MSNAFDKLVGIMEKLRGPDGCPWDRKQDLDTLRPYLLEETYELLEAMEKWEWEKVKEELGDLLLQIVFISQIAKEKGFFDVYDVAETISKKLIHRHPHVFGSEKRETPEEVERSWDELKKMEGKSPIPQKERGIPALLYAYRASKKASKLGFDWEDPKGAFEKVIEELNELKEAYDKGEGRLVLEEEVGDLLFAVSNLARLIKINPEEALRKGVDKFVDRFHEMIKTFSDPFEFKKLSLEEMDKLWEAVKGEDYKEKLKRMIKEKGFMYDPKGFTLSSGKKSNYYVDCRKVTFDPEGMLLSSKWLLEVIKKQKIDTIAGPAYGSIPLVFGVSLLAYLDGYVVKPVVVRKEEKKHGLGGNIIGDASGNRCAIVDDVITTGGSIKRVKEEVEEKGIEVVLISCLVDRREEKGDLFGIPVQSLTDLEELKNL